MVILGIDPGIATTGYAVIRKVRSGVQPVDWGIIETKKNQQLAGRLQTISEDLERLIKKYRPGLAVVELVYFAKNAKTAINVAQARGVVLLTLRKQKIKILELTPLQVKSGVVGYGAASKQQVQFMIKKLMNLKSTPKPDDAADALSLAYCGLTKK